MIVKHGNGRTPYGPGVSIALTGDEVATAIDAWLVAHNVHVNGPRTITVNGRLCESGHVYVDPSGHVIADGAKTSGRGEGFDAQGHRPSQGLTDAMDSTAIASELVRLKGLKQHDRALDLIFRWIDHDLKTTAGTQATTLLAEIDVRSLDEDLIVGLLTATFAGKHLLSARDDFAARARSFLQAELGERTVNDLMADL